MEKKEKPDENKVYLPKREINESLWNEVREKSRGSKEQKKEAIRILFEKHYNLPEESKDLIKELAKDSEEEVRLEVANAFQKYRTIPRGLHNDLIDIFATDPNPEIKKIMKEEIARRAEILKSFENIAKLYQDIWRNFKIEIPQLFIDTSFFVKWQDEQKRILDSLIKSTQFSAKVLFPAINSFNLINRQIAKGFDSYYTSKDLEIAEGPPRLKETMGARLLSELQKIEPGREKWREYQDKCKEILTYVLIPPLSSPSDEVRTEGHQRRDLIFHIPFGSAGFWDWVQQTHSALAVIFDCKNTKEELDGNTLVVTAKYLGKDRLGTFCIIISRNAISSGAVSEQRRLWKDESKMILCLNDQDIAKMTELKENGQDPAKVIDKAIRDFRVKL